MSEKIRVMVVDDSAFMRKAIKSLLEESGKIEVVELARNGKDAVEKIKSIDVDVITMDVEMPEMDGLEATKEIMRNNPVPIVMLSSVTQQGSEASIRATEYGAMDIIVKPSGNISLDIDKIRDEIVDKITGAAQSKLAKQRKQQLIPENKRETVVKKTAPTEYVRVTNRNTKKVRPDIIVIGSSTGGPQALQNVIPKLQKFDVPIIVIQHMPRGFTKSLASSLDSKSILRVKEAEVGEELKPNWVYIAPGGDKHLIVENRLGKKVFKDKDNSVDKKFYIPSVDVMLHSVVPLYKDKILGVILTGMGNDGLNGFKDMKQYDGYIIAESEESAVVYGMPRVVVEAGLADEVQMVQNIGERINKRMMV